MPGRYVAESKVLGRQGDQSALVLQGRHTGAGGFRALGHEMFGEEGDLLGRFLKSLRGQDHRQDGHAGVELNLHHAGDDSVGDEFVPVDAAVHHESRRHDNGVVAAVGQTLSLKRNLVGTRYLKDIDRIGRLAELFKFAAEPGEALVDDIAVPASLDKGDTRARPGSGGFDALAIFGNGKNLAHLSHPIGTTVGGVQDGKAREAPRASHNSRRLLSTIRTLTVGSGIAPDLLTPRDGPLGARGLMPFSRASFAPDPSAFTAGGEFHPAPRTFDWADQKPLCGADQAVFRLALNARDFLSFPSAHPMRFTYAAVEIALEAVEKEEVPTLFADLVAGQVGC